MPILIGSFVEMEILSPIVDGHKIHLGPNPEVHQTSSTDSNVGHCGRRLEVLWRTLLINDSPEIKTHKPNGLL